MDQTRQIRFLIPPFFLYGSLLWGLYWSDQYHDRWCDLLGSSEMILLYVSIAGVSALPLGFLIGTISIAVLKFRFWRTKHTYETWVSRNCLGQMKRRVRRHMTMKAFEELKRREKKLEEHLTEVTFNHGVLKEERPGVHTWLVRRWNAFYLSAHSLCALVLAHLVALVLGWGWPPLLWWCPSLVIGVALFLASRKAWKETMAMFEFQSEINFRAVK